VFNPPEEEENRPPNSLADKKGKAISNFLVFMKGERGRKTSHRLFIEGKKKKKK